ncbi:E3 ubiquitin-protein ligase HERC4-like protein, partial [Leptotrombidium deliense]
KGKNENDNASIASISRVYSCGSNERNQLGREGTWKRFQVIPELNNHLVVQLSCGYNHSLALTEAGQVFGFGCNLFGQLGIRTEHESLPKPTLIKKLAHEIIIQVACGGTHSIALTKKGLLYSWGSNGFGQLGTGDKGRCLYDPVVITKLSSIAVRCISAGGSHSMAVSYGNNIYVWGKNEFGQLGLGDTANRLSPCFQSALSNQEICYVSCGDDHSAAITRDGGLFTWGAGMYGQLGHGKFSNELLPRRVCELMGLQVSQVSCGRCHTLVVIGSKGRIYSFGLNGCGQLGIGTQTSESSPVKISGPWVEFDANEVTVRRISGPVVELNVNPEIKIESEWKDIDERMSIEDVDDDDFSGERDISLSPTFISSKGDDSDSPVVEEPEDMESAPCGRSSVEISEYISDPDSDCETEKPIFSNHLVSSLGGSVPGSHPRVNHVKLLAASASKGDQSFILTTRLDVNFSAVDYRNIGSTGNIYVFDNSVFDNMLLIDADERIPDEIIEYIESTFGSVASWNGSYLSSKTSESSPRINWESAYYGFNCLRKCPNQRLTEIAMNVIQEHLFPTLPTNCDNLDDEALRIFLLLPLFHIFHSEVQLKKIATLLSPFSKCMNRLNESAKKCVELWMTAVDKEYFQKLVEAYKSGVIFNLKEISEVKKKEEEEKVIHRGSTTQASAWLKDGLDMLRFLNNVNQKTKLLLYKEFYVPELHDTADIKMDYVEWLRAKHTTQKHPTNLFFCDYPFIFDAAAKTKILSVDSMIMRQKAAENVFQFILPLPHAQVVLTQSPFFEITVRRGSLVYSAAAQLLTERPPSEYKKPLKINFESKLSHVFVLRFLFHVLLHVNSLIDEEAVDAGAGVKKEFFLLLTKELLEIGKDDENSVPKFIEHDNGHTIWFNPNEIADYDLDIYELLGIVCALAIYNEVIIYAPFPLPLYKKILNEELELDDLSYLDQYLTKSLKEILHTSYTENEFDAVYCDLYFVATITIKGKAQEFELCKNGNTRRLTYKNRTEFVELYWKFMLNKSVEKSFGAFKTGFSKVVDNNLLHLFHAEELMQMVTGESACDWYLVEKDTVYKEPFSATHPTVKMFWKVFHSLSEEDKRNFLLFLTGSDKIPIVGLKMAMQPVKVSDEHLPVVHTCFNIVDLPEIYTSEEKLRSKLLQAIKHTQGFALA